MAEINPKDFAKVHYLAPPGPTGVVQVLIYLEQDGPDHLMIHHCLVMPELGTVDVKLTMETEPALAHYKAFDQAAAVQFWTKTTQEITQMFGDGTEDSDEGYAGDTATLVSVDEAEDIQVVFNEDTGVMSLETEEPDVKVVWYGDQGQQGAMMIPAHLVDTLTEDGLITGDDRDSMVMVPGFDLDDLTAAVNAYSTANEDATMVEEHGA